MRLPQDLSGGVGAAGVNGSGSDEGGADALSPAAAQAGRGRRQRKRRRRGYGSAKKVVGDLLVERGGSLSSKLFPAFLVTIHWLNPDNSGIRNLLPFSSRSLEPFLPVADAEFCRDLVPTMGFTDEIVQVDVLERHLLAGLSPNDYTGTCEDEILYDASFGEMEDNFVKYHIARWILLAILLILAWGVGLLMLLYLPVWIYVCRRDFHSRKLCLTPHAIVYKVTKPVTFPCFGVFKDEKHVILHSVSDIVVEQGYLQSFFGLYSIRIENIGVRRPASDDIQIIGVAHPHDFRKAILVHLSNTRCLNLGRKSYVDDDHQSISCNPITTASVPPLGDLILDKLDEVEISVKKMQARLEGVKHLDYIMKT
ncbi:hypothetical protein ABZP36_035074 [Zizania latifolia]